MSATLEMGGTYALEIPADHPALPGHFPGNPVVPGVLLLEGVMAAIEQTRPEPGLDRCRLRAVKFHSPALPGQKLLIALTPGAGSSFGFVITDGERRIATGTVESCR